jgi:AAA15 family ATPase/GTPase
MITKIIAKNFKRLDLELDLSSVVVFVGPNNSGKTSALQAISLWDFGLKKWTEVKRKRSSKSGKRTGAPINRKDIYTIPVPSLKELWKDLHVRMQKISGNKKETKNITIEIAAEGITGTEKWSLGLEFDFQNPEVCYVRPMEVPEDKLIEIANRERVMFLPPMSGLSAEEYKLEAGTINVFIGQGKTADVLRNLCWHVYNNDKEKWKSITDLIDRMFNIRVNDPEYDPTTGRIIVKYNENNISYDLINGGRGFHQVLLLLTYIHFSPKSIILIDEPDAHLEILRQKQIFNLLCENLRSEGSQLIIATHSEALLDEAIEKARIIAFLGKPHVVNSTCQLVKALTTIGCDQYILAEQKRWVLYLEGSTDLDNLRAFAEKLEHPVLKYLERPFTHYVGNIPDKAREHFYGLKEAFQDLRGIALYDRLDKSLQKNVLVEIMWKRREIENYIPLPDAVIRYFESRPRDLFSTNDVEIIREIINKETPQAALLDKQHTFWLNSKISEDYLETIFKKYAEKKSAVIPLSKKDYYVLIRFARIDEIDDEVREKLDAIYDVARIAEGNL